MKALPVGPDTVRVDVTPDYAIHGRREDLLALVDLYELQVADRWVRENLIESLAGSRKVDLAEGLGGLSRESLKGICRALDLDDSGEKSVIVERLIGAVSGAAQKAWDLVRTVRQNVTIDWTVKESLRLQLRVIVRRTLRKHGYPPDKQEKATQTVLEQAELMGADWAA